MNWQPIETAPKTDPVEMRAICLLGWCPDPGALNDGDIRVIWWEPRWKGGAWNSDRDLVEHPTHWMPLPEPPQ
jgi:hypothetical protein